MKNNRIVFNTLVAKELQIQANNSIGFAIGRVDKINGKTATQKQLNNLADKRINFFVKQQLARFTFLIDIVK